MYQYDSKSKTQSEKAKETTPTTIKNHMHVGTKIPVQAKSLFNPSFNQENDGEQSISNYASRPEQFALPTYSPLQMKLMPKQEQNEIQTLPITLNVEQSRLAPGVTKPNNTGIPLQMKERFESLSGFSFDDVKVHYNSDKPAQLQALAYTQGNQVYISQGQEKHLRHELGHVVQQKQGLVKPTMIRNGFSVNDNPFLEALADRVSAVQDVVPRQPAQANGSTVQLADWPGMTSGAEREIPNLQLLYPSVVAEKKWGKIEDNRLAEEAKTLWYVTRDMTKKSDLCDDAEEATLEMVSTPSVEEGIGNRNDAFVKYMAYLKIHAKTKTELKSRPRNDRTPKPQFWEYDIPTEATIHDDNFGEHYSVKALFGTQHAIVKISDALKTSDQLTVGVKLPEVFELGLPWLKADYRNDGTVATILNSSGIEENRKTLYKNIFAYIASASEKEAEIATRYFKDGKYMNGMGEPEAKNAWIVLPRTPKTEILNLITEPELNNSLKKHLKDRVPPLTTHLAELIKHCSEEEKESATKCYQLYYKHYCLVDFKVGKLATQDTIGGEKMYLFEYRNPKRLSAPVPPENLKSKWLPTSEF